MKKFRVRVTSTTYLETVIESEDEEAAWEIAGDMWGDDFTEIKDSHQWDVIDVTEVVTA